ncbi:MAG: aldo/keto reductase [Oscillospiraceae bacterium]|nr:aldo/keto reductase [Oscillospiraceae bacterium]
MKYRKLAGEDVSVLGFGCMRFPLTELGDPSTIDEEKSIAMIRHAIDCGVNYFDTAYVYHNRKSESFLAKALADGYREKVNIATKSPTWELKKEEDFDRMLDEQLDNLKTDHIDFYLMHALNKERMEIVKKFNIIEKLNRAKADGKIRHIGFSFHDDLDAFKNIINANPAWEFCQIQMNYINTDYQAGIAGLEYAYSKGLNVIIMEPLLGGKLAAPSPQVAKTLSDEKKPVEWARDSLWHRPEVSRLRRGMGAREQVCENIGYAEKAEIGMLSDADIEMLKKTKEIYDVMALVPCTKCAYCMPCPFGLDIPKTFEVYNMTAVSGADARGAYNELQTKADKCRKCKKCEQVCPQGIRISEQMTKIAEVFNK